MPHCQLVTPHGCEWICPIMSLDPCLIHRSMDPHESAPNGIWIGSLVFAQLISVPNTDHIYV